MNVQFDCTQCGKCCHDLKLPLSVEEAIQWSRQGHQVQLLCDAVPDFGEAEPEDQAGLYRRQRSFRAMSDTLPVRVNVILVAAHAGPCPHLRADMRCGNYDKRPRVCRIYPAEIAPHIAFDPQTKQCPPEAWDESQPPLMRDGRVIPEETLALIEAHRAATLDDVSLKAAACALLGVKRTALGNEGYAVHSPEPAVLADILEQVRSALPATDTGTKWSIMTNRRSTLAMLADAGAYGLVQDTGPGYMGFFPDAG